MNNQIDVQSNYWNREAQTFQAIYTHKKSWISNYLDKIFRRDMYERFVYTMEHSEPIRSGIFLDVGCGSGQYSIELARKGAAKVVGIDIADTMLQLARKLSQENQVDDRCEFFHTDLLEFSPEHGFTVSIGIGLFDYISDPLPVLKKMRQVTSRRIIVSFPRLLTWRAPLRKVRLWLRGCPVHFYTRKKVVELFVSAGISKIEISNVGKLFCVSADVG